MISYLNRKISTIIPNRSLSKNDKTKILILGYGFNGKSRFLQLAKSVHPDTLSMATTSEVQVSTLASSNSDVSRVEMDNLNYTFINIENDECMKPKSPHQPGTMTSTLLRDIKKESKVGLLLFFFGMNEYDHNCEDPTSKSDIKILNKNFNSGDNRITKIYVSSKANNINGDGDADIDKYMVVKNNRLRENVEFFKRIVGDRKFKNTQVVVLLSGKEVFDDKLKSKPLREYFPEYTGPNESREAGAFISNLFASADKSTNNSNRLAIHTFNPYDQEEIKNLIYFVQTKVE